MQLKLLKRLSSFNECQTPSDDWNTRTNDESLRSNNKLEKTFVCHEQLLPPWKKPVFVYTHRNKRNSLERIIICPYFSFRLVHRTLLYVRSEAINTHRARRKCGSTFIRSYPHLHNRTHISVRLASVFFRQLTRSLVFAWQFRWNSQFLVLLGRKTFSSCWETCLRAVGARLSIAKWNLIANSRSHYLTVALRPERN